MKSRCCSAEIQGELLDDIGVCGECGEWSEWYDEDKEESVEQFVEDVRAGKETKEINSTVSKFVEYVIDEKPELETEIVKLFGAFSTTDQ